MSDTHIGQRIKALREAAGMRQEELAELLDLNSRQIVSQIETGTRRLTATELVAVLKRFDVSLDKLTNPFLLLGRSSFSWRQRNVPQSTLQAFEERAGEWIGAYRELRGLAGQGRSKLLLTTGLTYTSPFEDAANVGEVVAGQLELGDKPAFTLAKALEEKLDILVLMVEAESGISGAACQLPNLSAVLINRNESFARRNSDLAHELFHILTWNEMRPDHIESSDQIWDGPASQRRPHKAARNQRIEQLADNFASGLLMPARSLDLLGTPRSDAQWLMEASALLGVSSRALKWRLVNTRRCPELSAVQEAELVAAGRVQAPDLRQKETPPLFSRPFMQTIIDAIEQGELSARRAQALLQMDRASLGELCDAYEIPRPVELGGQPRQEIAAV